MKLKIAIIFLFLMYIMFQCVGAVEYQIPNSTATFGYEGNFGLNISAGSSQPANSYLLYNDGNNQTYAILPPDAPDGNLDIIIVPVDKGLFGWLNWI